jgi:hypothetical protein
MTMLHNQAGKSAKLGQSNSASTLSLIICLMATVVCGAGLCAADEKKVEPAKPAKGATPKYWIARSQKYIEQFISGPALDGEEFQWSRLQLLSDLASVQASSGDHKAMEKTIKQMHLGIGNISDPDMTSYFQSVTASARALAGQFDKARALAKDFPSEYRAEIKLTIIYTMIDKGQTDRGRVAVQELIKDLSGRDEMVFFATSVIEQQMLLDDQAGAMRTLAQHVTGGANKASGDTIIGTHHAKFGSKKDAANWLKLAREQFSKTIATPATDESEQEDRDYARMEIAVLEAMLGNDTRAIKMLQKLTDPLMQAEAFARIAADQWNLGKDAEAKRTLDRAMKQTRQIEDLDNRLLCWYSIGFTAGYAAQTKSALKWVAGMDHPATRSAASTGIADGLHRRHIDDQIKARLKKKAEGKASK